MPSSSELPAPPLEHGTDASMARLHRKILSAVCTLVTFARAISRSPGCGKTLPATTKTGGLGSSNNISLTTSNGLTRSYLLHIPTSYSKDVPTGLILSFHGRGQSGAHQEKLSKFSDSSVNPDMLAAYPNGVDKQWQGDPAATTDDVPFTLAMLKHIGDEYCIDLDRIYAAGKSNGGGFALNVLACSPVASTKIAAFAGFAGAYYQEKDVKHCDPESVRITCDPGRRPVPIFG
ncbi:hypothetical protein CLAFUW4_01811 [Fulvia fulva]|uniref:feruloyl esterase n=1 Tax=Passalora fulva TaxID=5499 RepID=A0A9Q8L748_PASFU|nr:uncharacterized protein CLAFUR5_01807 [Fulvia fulva]KAK4634427.1 hypothetical protein CLAFUR4_01809 [Fulvia fulva]KAK4637018.1 hypothetical protein CLAFUR0_01811 [Fulvia fulva]UJO12082.1 hypothetical protein CLAFUR5_01807 [Fulvia fulva]WPV08925.1 hypothetical protein CLAFUW4_01811 [Fulvia fulva]WPV23164.1 hypothetical protein CLAFUW7_01812 [Fulvia fulva]